MSARLSDAAVVRRWRQRQSVDKHFDDYLQIGTVRLGGPCVAGHPRCGCEATIARGNGRPRRPPPYHADCGCYIAGGESAPAIAFLERAMFDALQTRRRITADVNPALAARIYAAAERLRPPGAQRNPVRIVVEAALTLGLGAVEKAIPLLVLQRDGVRVEHAADLVDADDR